MKRQHFLHISLRTLIMRNACVLFLAVPFDPVIYSFCVIFADFLKVLSPTGYLQWSLSCNLRKCISNCTHAYESQKFHTWFLHHIIMSSISYSLNWNSFTTRSEIMKMLSIRKCGHLKCSVVSYRLLCFINFAVKLEES